MQVLLAHQHPLEAGASLRRPAPHVSLDPPVCTADSARGLILLEYRPRTARDLDVLREAEKASLGTVLAARRGVPDGRHAGGDAGRRAICATVPCSAMATTPRCP